VVSVALRPSRSPGCRLRSLDWHFRALLQQPWKLLSLTVFGGYIAVAVGTFRDYGLTWDEAWYHAYGNYLVQWYASGFQDDRGLKYLNLMYYGGFPHIVTQLMIKFSGMNGFDAGHLTNTIFALIGVIFTYRLGVIIGGGWAGLVSALFIILTPRFYGHSFHNRVDIPTAALHIASLYYVLVTFQKLPTPPMRILMTTGICIGLALGTRVGSVVLVAYLFLLSMLWLAVARVASEPAKASGRSALRTLLVLSRSMMLILAVSYVVMLAWWPSAQVRPLIHPVKSLLVSTNFVDGQMPMLFDGQVVWSTNLPWYYDLKWFSITLPEFYFVGLLLGSVSLVAALRRGRVIFGDEHRVRAGGVLLLLTAVAVPLAYSAIRQPIHYDEVRHFLFVVPPLAVLAALGVVQAVMRGGRNPLAVVVILTVFASLTLTLIDMVRLHPYQYVFFNRLVGHGLEGAAPSFETDYWGSSYREGVQLLQKHYGAVPREGSIRVASCSFPLLTSYYLSDERFTYVFDRPDVVLATTRVGCRWQLRGTVIQTVERMGVPLLYVVEMEQSETTRP
jgi:4-amino-4-deoxy-L-arabinose transferase-like glycosyltransferase